jgi:hypothetical protein
MQSSPMIYATCYFAMPAPGHFGRPRVVATNGVALIDTRHHSPTALPLLSGLTRLSLTVFPCGHACRARLLRAC